MEGLCIVENCNLPLHAKSFCHKHYLRDYYHGDPLFVKKVKAEEYPNGKKWCAKCRFFLDLSEFWDRGLDKKEPYCKSCRKSQVKNFRLINPAKHLLRQCRAGAKKRKLEFKIDLEDIIIPDFCPVLGIPLSMDSKDNANHPSIDRIDNSRGYVKGNVRVISWRANDLKKNSQIWEMELVLKYLKGEL